MQGAPGEICGSAELYLLGLLDPDETREFENHLNAGCAPCKKLLLQHEEMIVQLSLQDPQVPTVELRERLRAKLQEPVEVKPHPVEKAIVFDRLGLLVVRSAEMNWQAGPVQGVWIKPLFLDKEKMSATNLVRLQPGVSYPAHRHAEIEEVYMLAGDLKFKDLHLVQGDYCRAEGGTSHTESYSEKGCLLLITTSIHDELLPTV